MTKEQLDIANAISKQIEKAKNQLLQIEEMSKSRNEYFVRIDDRKEVFFYLELTYEDIEPILKNVVDKNIQKIEDLKIKLEEI